jgi:hypothetical protein
VGYGTIYMDRKQEKQAGKYTRRYESMFRAIFTFTLIIIGVWVVYGLLNVLAAIGGIPAR